MDTPINSFGRVLGQFLLKQLPSVCFGSASAHKALLFQIKPQTQPGLNTEIVLLRVNALEKSIWAKRHILRVPSLVSKFPNVLTLPAQQSLASGQTLDCLLGHANAMYKDIIFPGNRNAGRQISACLPVGKGGVATQEITINRLLAYKTDRLLQDKKCHRIPNQYFRRDE